MLLAWKSVWLIAGLHLLWPVQATVHRIITTNRFIPEKIHEVEFDDQSATLRHVKTRDASNTHVWLSLSHDKRTIYGSSLENGRLVSYDVSTLETTGSIESFGECEGKNSAYNMISNHEPHYVVSGAFGTSGGCGMSLSLGKDGSLKAGAQSWELDPKSSTHGFEFWDVNGTQVLYTADMGTDSIWTHSIDDSGGVTQIDRMTFRKSEVKPRFITIHPSGTWMYVILEHDNTVTALRRTHSGKLYEQKDVAPFSLVPDGADNEEYWSAVLTISPNKRYLWATSRGRGKNSGYISCFLLDEEGALVKKMFMMPTGSYGTTTSSLITSPWSDKIALYGDAPSGFLAVLQLVGPVETNDGLEYSSAKVISHLDIAPGSCCSNALWVD